MSRKNSQTHRVTPELQLLWYPHLPPGTLTQEAVDEALRRARLERAQMLASLASRTGALLKRAATALLRGIAVGQERRARAALARARQIAPDDLVGVGATARGGFAGPVREILSQPETARGAADTDARTGDEPRLAA